MLESNIRILEISAKVLGQFKNALSFREFLIEITLKVSHRSKFSTYAVGKKKPVKKSGLHRDSNP